MLERLTELLPVLDIDPAVADAYGRIRASLERRGEIIGGNDLWIAAHAMAVQVALVTNNVGDFRRVAGLRVEDWSVPSG